jgi:hypothetical protein
VDGAGMGDELEDDDLEDDIVGRSVKRAIA